jgi:outer membrane autotransporter protein
VTALAFDKRTQDSLIGSLGARAGVAFTNRFAVLTPQLDLQWLHEFRNDQQILTARFAEDLRPNPTRLNFLTQPPDRDSYTARLSIAAIFTDGLSAFATVEMLLGHEFQDRFGASLGVRWEL